MSKLLKQKVIIDEKQFPYSELSEESELTGTTQQGEIATPMSDEAIEKVVEQKVEEKLNEKVSSQEHEEKIVAEKKVEQMIDNPSRTLFKTKGIFPFNFFPDEICIEELRVNIITRSFFASQQIQTISYKDLKKIEVETNIFFGTIRFITWTAVENAVQISFLPRDEAFKARRLIEGLKLLNEQDIDLSQIATEELIDKLEHLGSVK